jgi:hypothetical protein
MSEVDEITEAYREAFDAKREVLIGESAKLLLLKADGGSQAYSVKATITKGWTARFSEFHGHTVFEVADNTGVFAELVRVSSHAAVIDSDLPSLNNALHRLRRESHPPLGGQPYWKLSGEDTGDKYAPPSP